MSEEAADVVTRTTAASFDDAVARLIAAIESRGLRVFDVIDHQAAATEAGLSLRPTRVVVFGGPAAGTPLMVAHPLLALELPLRILVWEGDDHQVRLSYLDAQDLGARFGLAAEETGPLAGPARMIDLAELV
jgi:uncharacterized protein (DUF302 family)